MKRALFNVLLILALSLSLSPAAFAQAGERPDRPIPASLTDLKLSEPLTTSEGLAISKLESGLLAAQGPRQVVVRLRVDPVAQAAAEGVDRSAQLNQLALVESQQASIVGLATSLDPKTQVLGSAQRVLNAVMLEIDAASLRALAADPAVISINPVIDYEVVLTQTVPYVGGTAVHEMGYTGEGIRVAVLDSGIDYTHANLGGSGDPADYEANDPTIIEPGTFPTDKVIGGFDFVGGAWTGGATSPPLMPDPDPLDDGPGAGHGTHVADIIAGVNGMAPDAELYALKVCSSVSTACSGVALIEAMDWALDPNGDGDISDHVDIINMSLGAIYGQAFYDDLSHAVDQATLVGVLTVAASGNAQDKPYVTDTPAAAITALSVAQTQTPWETLQLMEIASPAAIAGLYQAVHQPWSPEPASLLEGPVQYGDGAGGNLNGCAPFPEGSLAGKIVLVDRGACNFTLKAKNISLGGALAGLIGLIAPGDPFEGGDGGDRPITVPTYMISQAVSNLIKDNLAAGVIVRFDPANQLPLVGTMTNTSSRGPDMSFNRIKPEIGAPGGSFSAEAGTGTGVTQFGGTSGATPMVAGAAALLMQAFPDRSPLEVKAVLVNSADTNIFNNPPFFGGDLAPITRIGGGELRANRAVTSPAAVWDTHTLAPALSFGFHDITKKTLTLRKNVTVHNYSDNPITYHVHPTFRFANDEENGAVDVTILPEMVTVQPHQNASFWVVLTVDGEMLREWGLNSGSLGASGDALTLFEYDGFLELDDTGTTEDDENPLHIPWQVLPRKAGNVSASLDPIEITGEALGFPAGFKPLHNRGIGPAYIDTYSLISNSEIQLPGEPGGNAPIVDFRRLGVATFPVPAGFCSANESFVMSFAVNTWDRQTHANAPAAFEFDLDTDRDGDFDYAVFNFDLAFPGLSNGQNVTWVLNLTTGLATAFFFTDHGTNSQNTVLSFCAEQIGMTTANFGQFMDVSALAVDIYFTGNVTDLVTGMTIAPLGERYIGLVNDIPPGGTETLTVLDLGPEGTNPGEIGVLLFLNAARAGNVRGGAPVDNEAMAFPVVSGSE